MPSLEAARRISNTRNNGAKTLGQTYKEQSDWFMEETWEGDLQSKVAYIYDHFHDDFFTDEYGITRTLAEGMTYENTHKTKVDIKFIVKTYQSMDKDQVEYYIQFKPSQKFSFDKNDELYYFEEIHKRFNNEFPIGLWCDIPDDKKVYHKWLICRSEPSNQFPKFLVLPADYELMWIEKRGTEKIKRRMWSVLRMQSSYTIGVYSDLRFTHVDNQDKIWLPMNSITSKFWYTSDDSTNMRVIVSTLSEHPSTWRITKCENVQPFGIQKLTIYSNFFDPHNDYVNMETGEMYADYYNTEIPPVDLDTPIQPLSLVKISTSTFVMKVGGSYKNLTINILNHSEDDITKKYSDATFNWSCSIDGEDWTDKVTWKDGVNFNQKKIKFPNDASVIGKILIVKCVITKDNLPIESEPIQLALME